MIHKILHRLYVGFFIIGTTMLWTLSGCDDDPVDSFLQFSADNLLLKAAGDTVAVDVTAGSGWKAESMADWCTAVEGRGEFEGKLVIIVTPSDDVYERGTAVKVTCGDNVVRLSVRQEPMVFEVTEGKKSLAFGKNVSNDTLKIRTNMDWKVEIADTTGWLQVADTVGSGNVNLVFTTTDNSQKKGRTTTVRLRYGVRSMKLAASQEGGIRADGNFRKHYGEREPESGFNLIFLGDGFTSDDLISETGLFDMAVEEACEALFAVEPYKSYKDYFNVWSVACESGEQGAGTSDDGGPELRNTALQCCFDEECRISGNHERAFGYASTILGMNENILKTNSVVIVLVNDGRYGGTTYWFGNPADRNVADYRTISYVPLNRDTLLPGGFTNILLHEVGGHAIGKLADEWSTEQEFTVELRTLLNSYRGKLYCQNVGLPTAAIMVEQYPEFTWSFFQRIPRSKDTYAEVLKPADGGFGCVSGKVFISHCEEKSCMMDNVPYFNVASRYAIVQWLLFRLNVYEYNASNMTEVAKYFFEHDRYELPDDCSVSDRPPLPMPVAVE